MISMWSGHFTDLAPVSGEQLEAHFNAPGARSGAWVWVRFESREGESWSGCFRAGRSSPSSRAIASADARHVFVVVGGLAYCVDAKTRSLTSVSADSGYSDAISVPESECVALADLTRITISSPQAVLWVTPRVAHDGIRLIAASATELMGAAETGHGPAQDRPFRVDLVRRVVTGGFVDEFAEQ